MEEKLDWCKELVPGLTEKVFVCILLGVSKEILKTIAEGTYEPKPGIWTDEDFRIWFNEVYQKLFTDSEYS